MPRVAVFGCGRWGMNHVRNFSELGALAVVCDPNVTALGRVMERFPVRTSTGISDALNDPTIDGVVVATPASTHSDVARQVLLAGKHVLIEKPLALNMTDARELDRLATQQGRILMVGHLLKYHPAVRVMHQYIREGRLGKIFYFFANRLNYGTIRHEEDSLWSFAPHDISIFLMFANRMPDTAWCMGGAFLNPEVADRTMTYLTFGRIHGQINVSWLHPYKEHRIAVAGEKGMIVFTDSVPENKLMFYPHRVEWIDQLPVASAQQGEPVAYGMDEPLRLECQHFLDCISEGRRPFTDGQDGIRVLEVLEACQESMARHGAPVKLHQPPREFWADATAQVHPQAVIGKGTKIWQHSQVLAGASIGERCVIGHNCTVFGRAKLGNHVTLESNVDVWDLVTLEDDVFVGPSAAFTNDRTPRTFEKKGGVWLPTLAKRGASIGANVTVAPGVTIGEYAVVGVGSVVTKDIPAYALVFGNPARFRFWVCKSNHSEQRWARLQFDSEGVGHCPKCERRYQLSDNVVEEVLVSVPQEG